MTSRLVLALVCVVGCATEKSGTSSEPVLTGDTCSIHDTAATCQGDTDCHWLGTGCACPPNDPSCSCPPGACVSDSGSGSGSGSTGAACACPNGGVCYEQVGGPAQPAGSTTDIACTTPTPGSGDPCARIVDQGRCEDSATVSGLCVCDNGIR